MPLTPTAGSRSFTRHSVVKHLLWAQGATGAVSQSSAVRQADEPVLVQIILIVLSTLPPSGKSPRNVALALSSFQKVPQCRVTRRNF